MKINVGINGYGRIGRNILRAVYESNDATDALPPKLTVSSGFAGNPGDIVYYSDPSDGGFVGWIYSSDNDWRRFGTVSTSGTLNIGIFEVKKLYKSKNWVISFSVL